MYNLINKAATSSGQNLSQHWIWITFLGGALCKQSSAVDQIIDYSFFIKLYLIASGKGDIKDQKASKKRLIFNVPYFEKENGDPHFFFVLAKVIFTLLHDKFKNSVRGNILEVSVV